MKTDLTNPIYHDENAARTHLESLLWPSGPVCPRCKADGARVTKLMGKSTRPGVYKCKDCRKPFTVTVGTVMERSKIPLFKWVLAAQLMASSKKGFSALQLHRMLGTNYETAWFLFHRLRECAIDTDAGPLGGPGNPVEVDETYIGGKEKNKHANKRTSPGGGSAGKSVVVSLVEREGRARSFHIARVTGKTLRKIIVTNIDRKSYLMTDSLLAYRTIGREFAGHVSVDHSRGEYVRDKIFHSNTVESYFALLKRGLMGTFHAVSEAHLYRYLAEFDFRHNTRKISDGERADALLSGAKGKRLMYRQPDQTANA
jgi:transposase-like protein